MKRVSRTIFRHKDLHAVHTCTKSRVPVQGLCRKRQVHILTDNSLGLAPMSRSFAGSTRETQENTGKSSPTPDQSSSLADHLRSNEDVHEKPPTPEGSVNPSDTSILLFPGQGSQFVGMAKELLPYPNVKAMFNLASEVLGYNLLDICLNGPKRKLDQTEFCQPATFVTSLAAIERLREESPSAVENCSAAAGFSVGEYAALVFSDAISFEDGLRIIKVRARGMQTASELEPSGMMSCFLSHHSKLSYACHVASLYCKRKLDIPEPVCTVANYLYPECKVVAGNAEALDFLEENKKEFGLLRTKRLPVSGAFHTRLMKPAVKSLRNVIEETPIKQPLISVYSNVTGTKHSDKPNRIQRSLVEQVYMPVKWEQIMHNMLSRPQGEAFPRTFELGPGKQLGTLLRMVNKKAHRFYKNIGV